MYQPNAQDIGARGSRIWGQPGLHSKTLSKIKKNDEVKAYTHKAHTYLSSNHYYYKGKVPGKEKKHGKLVHLVT